MSGGGQQPGHHARRFPAEEWPRLVAAHRREVAEPEHYVRSFPWSGFRRVVDLGAGPGFFVPALLAALDPDAELVAVDVQPEMLAVLAERLALPPNTAAGSPSRVTPVVASLDNLPFASASCDAAWCAFVVHELPDLSAFAAEVRRILRPGAPLRILEWSPLATPHGPPLEERLPPAPILAALRSAGFGTEPPRPVTDCQYAIAAQ